MIENLALVASSAQGRVRLSPFSRSGCARCDAGEGCGGGVFGKLVRRRLDGLDLEDPGLDLHQGDTVVLGLPGGALLRATLVAYLAPLLALLMAAGLASAGGAPDPLVAVAGLGGLLAGLGLAPALRRRGLDAMLRPRILRRANAREQLPGSGRVCV